MFRIEGNSEVAYRLVFLNALTFSAAMSDGPIEDPAPLWANTHIPVPGNPTVPLCVVFRSDSRFDATFGFIGDSGTKRVARLLCSEPGNPALALSRQVANAADILMDYSHDGLIRPCDISNISVSFPKEPPQNYQFIVTPFIGRDLWYYSAAPAWLHSDDELKHLLVHLVDTLRYLHGANCVHGSIRPDHVVLHKRHMCLFPVLIGLSRFKQLGSADATRLEHFSEDDRPYMAPELDDRPITTFETDVFALGKLLFYLIEAGQPSPELRAMVDRMVAPDPKNRLPIADIADVVGEWGITVQKYEFPWDWANRALSLGPENEPPPGV
jgi:serine/threonine protein kinase